MPGTDETICFAQDAMIATMSGERPVQTLMEGDRVITRDSGTAVLRGIRRRKARAKLVAIRAGTLGSARPDSDAMVPAGQEILVRDWRAKALFGASRALVPAERLADGEFIRVIGTREVELLELQFDAPHILYADGLELASARSRAPLSVPIGQNFSSPYNASRPRLH